MLHGMPHGFAPCRYDITHADNPDRVGCNPIACITYTSADAPKKRVLIQLVFSRVERFRGQKRTTPCRFSCSASARGASRPTAAKQMMLALILYHPEPTQHSTALVQLAASQVMVFSPHRMFVIIALSQRLCTSITPSIIHNGHVYGQEQHVTEVAGAPGMGSQSALVSVIDVLHCLT